MRGMRTKPVRTGALCLGAAALLAVGVGSTTAMAQQADTLSVGVAVGPQTMNPQGADTDSNMSIMTNVFDSLVRRDNSGDLQPDLATSWKRIDANTWRFHLRKGVKYQNGNDFDWKDVKFTFERMKNPQVSEFLNFGALVTSVKPVDDDKWTIDITTKEPVPYFVQNLPQIFIMDKESTKSRSQGEVGLHPIGTGPYKMTKWVKGSSLSLDAYDGYWGKAPSIKHVKVLPITEDSTRMAAISTGQVDLLQGIPVKLAQAIEKNPNVTLVSRPGRRSIFLQLGNKEGTPTADVRVRKAIYLAIDEDAIIKNILHGHAKPASQIPDPPTIGYDKDIKRLSYNLEKAKKLLKEAGYADGFEITLTGPNDRYVEDKQIEATIATQLSRAGIKVRVDSIPKAVFFPKVAEHKVDFYLIGWFDGAYDFGRTYAKLLHCVDDKAGYGGTNGASFCNKDMDKQFAKANSIVDPDERAKALQKLNVMAAKQVAFIPLHYQEDDYAVSKKSKLDFTPRADTWLVFSQMSTGQ